MKRTSNDSTPEGYPKNLKAIFCAIDAENVPLAIQIIQLYAKEIKAKKAIFSERLTESTDKAISLLENGRPSEAKEELNRIDTLFCDAINNPSLLRKNNSTRL